MREEGTIVGMIEIRGTVVKAVRFLKYSSTKGSLSEGVSSRMDNFSQAGTLGMLPILILGRWIETAIPVGIGRVKP